MEKKTLSQIFAGRRNLLPSEIECRVGQVSKKDPNTCTILLYKNARVDMAMLDELVGAENWQREHREVKGNLYCGVGIYDADKGETIWKWDCGVESQTEAQKGEASDSFKRACVNWGIGRELYTAPRIDYTCSDKEMWNGKPYPSLSVSAITYNDNREITHLTLVDKFGRECFTWTMGDKPVSNRGRDKKQNTSAIVQLTKEQYWEIVEKFAKGVPAKSGENYRDAFQKMTGADAATLKQFDADVHNYETVNGLI